LELQLEEEFAEKQTVQKEKRELEKKLKLMQQQPPSDEGWKCNG
jgi:hypothetical protein